MKSRVKSIAQQWDETQARVKRHQAMIADYQSGLTMEKTAYKNDASINEVFHVLKSNNIPRRKRGPVVGSGMKSPTKDHARMIKMRANGATLQEVADTFECSRQYVSQVMSRWHRGYWQANKRRPA